jgi:hypothetical protein
MAVVSGFEPTASSFKQQADKKKWPGAIFNVA